MRFAHSKLVALAALCTVGLPFATSAEPLPAPLAGTWHITRVLPTKQTGCWSAEQAQPLVGSTLTYGHGSMHWRGGEVPVDDITTREVTATQFQKESSGAADFAQLGIHAPRVTEVNFQHEDMDITGASTEVPGDSVLLVGGNRIVVSACGVYMEATRGGGASALRVSAHR